MCKQKAENYLVWNQLYCRFLKGRLWSSGHQDDNAYRLGHVMYIVAGCFVISVFIHRCLIISFGSRSAAGRTAKAREYSRCHQ